MRKVTLALLAFSLAGCATASERFVVFPIRGQTPEQIERDRAECEALAQAKRNDANALAGLGIGTAGGAAAGAALGAVSGAFFDQAGWGAGYGAATGATAGLITGLSYGVAADHNRYLAIYVVCMQTRGYNVAG